MYFRRTLTFPAPTLIRAPLEEADNKAGGSLVETRRRVVSFNLAANVVIDNTTWSKKSCKARWYTKKQIKAFKDDFFSTARDYRDSKSAAITSYKQVLLSVYDECCQAALQDVKNNSNNDNDDTFVLSSLTEFSLRTFVSKAQHRSGMERQAVKEIEYDKRRRKADLHDEVFGAQRAYRAGSPHARAELVRRSSQALSLPARLFAHQIAMALALSVQP